MRAFETALEVGSRNPMRGTFPACCASAKLDERRANRMSSQAVFMAMRLPCWAMDMPQSKLNENQYFRGQTNSPEWQSDSEEYQI
jgi:hypothetical protein